MKGYMKKNIKVLTIISIGLFVFSCTHKPYLNDKREPTAVPVEEATHLHDVISYGEFYLNETSYQGKPADELEYILAVKCQNPKIQVGVSIPYSEVKPGQRGWITRWTRDERLKAQNQQMLTPRKKRINERSALYVRPMLYVKYKTSQEDPCLSGMSVTGYAPQFSKNIKNLQ